MKNKRFITMIASLLLTASVSINANAIVSQDIPLPVDIQADVVEIMTKEEINICPTILLSLCYEESKGNAEHVKKKFEEGSKYRGVCQCNTYYFKKYLNELNLKASDIDEPYNALWLCAEFLEDMFEKYGDEPYLVVMCWAMGEDNAVRAWNKGYILPYARRVVDRSADWEPIYYAEMEIKR